MSVANKVGVNQMKYITFPNLGVGVGAPQVGISIAGKASGHHNVCSEALMSNCTVDCTALQSSALLTLDSMHDPHSSKSNTEKEDMLRTVQRVVPLDTERHHKSQLVTSEGRWSNALSPFSAHTRNQWDVVLPADMPATVTPSRPSTGMAS